MERNSPEKYITALVFAETNRIEYYGVALSICQFWQWSFKGVPTGIILRLNFVRLKVAGHMLSWRSQWSQCVFARLLHIFNNSNIYSNNVLFIFYVTLIIFLNIFIVE